MQVLITLLFLMYSFLAGAQTVTHSVTQTETQRIDESSSVQKKSVIVVGSKAFTEGYLLGELIAQNLEDDQTVEVVRRFGMGSTGILFEALQSGQIHLYPEYTGTIAQAILKKAEVIELEDIQRELSAIGFVMSPPLGFDNNYALAVAEAYAEKHNLRSISDLHSVADSIRTGFSHEFVSRPDGLMPLLERYKLNLTRSMQPLAHSLSYQAIAAGSVDLIDVYSTDAKIKTLNLRVLEDDRNYFTRYQAVILARADFVEANPTAWAIIQEMKGTLTEQLMTELNAKVDDQGMNFRSAVVSHFQREVKPISNRRLTQLIARTKEHSLLVAVSILFSIIVGIPLGILANRNQITGQAILMTSGLLQTIPSLALLCFLIPFFGIGLGSALIALCLYALLPVVMNTFIGLRSIDGRLLEMANALRLTPMQRLVRVELPLASRSILSGIRTSAVISIGTATLAALIGAGGYGAIILAGLAINDVEMIMLGAAPSAAMALIVHGLFEVISLVIIPKGIR